MGFEQERQLMVKDQLRARDITDARVLKVMGQVPREDFVPSDQQHSAYHDSPLAIGSGQTISQPYIVAKMCQLLNLTGEEKVLDIGTGSGYQAAVLSLLAKEVVSIEIVETLANKAKKTLASLGYDNVEVIIGDGRQGVPDRAPFDRIIAAATATQVPPAWKKQLKPGGIIVLPLKVGWQERLVRLTKKGKKLKQEEFCPVAFVPLVS